MPKDDSMMDQEKKGEQKLLYLNLHNTVITVETNLLSSIIILEYFFN